jgi:hypothetical protein
VHIRLLVSRAFCAASLNVRLQERESAIFSEGVGCKSAAYGLLLPRTGQSCIGPNLAV